MALQLFQLSDKLQRLDWKNTLFVDCGECFLTDRLNVKCCLCQKDLKTSNPKNHALIGGLESNVEEVITQIHYLCRNCKRQCTVCGHKNSQGE